MTNQYSIIKKYKIIILKINTNEDVANLIWEDIMKNLDEKVNKILLTSSNKLLNNKNVLNKLFEHINANTQIKKVIIETNFNEMDNDKIEYLRQALRNKEIDIEFMVEKLDDANIYYLNQKYDIRKANKIIDILKENNIKVEMLVYLGLPLLSTLNQMEECLKVISWAVSKNAEEVVICPCNINRKSKLYMEKKIKPISHWLIIQLMDKIPKNYLSNISLTSYKKEFVNDKNLILPTSCNNCEQVIMDFYDKFMESRDNEERKKYIQNIISELQCNCKEEIKHEIFS